VRCLLAKSAFHDTTRGQSRCGMEKGQDLQA